MSNLSQAKRKKQFLGASLAVILAVAGAAQVSAQERYKLSADLSRAPAPTKNVSMDSTLAFPKRETLGESTAALDLKAPMLDRPSLPESSVKETRESVLEQIAALGRTFGQGLKAASSWCTGWQGGGFKQPWIGPDPTVERACIFQFELPAW